MTAQIILEWKFLPPNYFEEDTYTTCHGYTLKIEKGKVETSIDGPAYKADSTLRTRLHEFLKATFKLQQVLTHLPHHLYPPVEVVVHPDGRKDYIIQLESAVSFARVQTPDVCMTDQNGNIVKDTKRERIEARKQFRELLCASANDEILAALLRSYEAAVNDPNNELVHLYEIRDALKKKFPNKKAREAVGLDSFGWSRLGELCNDEQIAQGRHRGQAANKLLRKASEDELAEARDVAKEMIYAYGKYLKQARLEIKG